jgi:hypothetical protein
MKKLILCLLGLLVLMGLFVLWLALAPVRSGPVSETEVDEARVKSGQAAPAPPLQAALVAVPMNRNVRLAIGSLGFRDDEKNRQLGDLATVKLTGARGFEMVERQSLAKILNELNLGWSGLVRANDALRVGKLLRADWFLLGTDANISGTNSLVVRVVDARTGTMRDAGVFPTDKPLTQLAEDLAGFMRQSRADAAAAKIRIYLAIGAFEDLSVNNRQADFPAQLRGYLTAAYRGSGVNLLEREYVETLLQEVHLDMAGLTDEGGQNPAPMQSAFWLVNGNYQSYETTNLQVEVNLEVDRVFGRSWHRTLRGLPGEPVGRLVRAAIDDTMSRNSGTVAPRRMSEARLQMYAGEELKGNLGGSDLVFVSEGNADPQLADQQKRRLEEAIRSFETVLLLQPTNRLAKMYLAACFRSMRIMRQDEACGVYQELIDEPVEDQWSERVQLALGQTMKWFGPDQRLRWFQAAASHATNATAITFYKQQAEAAQKEVILASGNTPEAAKLAEEQLVKDLESYKSLTQGKSGGDHGHMGLDPFVEACGWDHATAAQKLVELLPKLNREVPGLEPYLLASVLSYQVDRNTPLAADFQRTLNDFIEHPNHVSAPTLFWNGIRWGIYDWCLATTNHSLAINLIEGERRAASEYQGLVDFDSQENIKLAYLYLAAERWQDALNIFETFTNKAFEATAGGPWGQAFKPVSIDKAVSLCRTRLGLAAIQDPRKFDMGKPVLCLCSPSTFAADDDGLWVGIGGRLLRLTFDLKTNLDVKLPIDESVQVAALCLASSNVWIGTQGAGLIEFDKSSHECRRCTQEDGLLMDMIWSLCPSEDALWIGYGDVEPVGFPVYEHRGGGIGVLDLRSRHLTSFTPSLASDTGSITDTHLPGPAGQPTRHAVSAIALGDSGDIWFVARGDVLRSFHRQNGTWGTFPQITLGFCLASDHEHLYTGRYEYLSIPATGPLGLETYSFDDRNWRSFASVAGLPSCAISALALDGRFVWVGGMGYVACVDPGQNKVLKFASIPAQSVDKIQISGGYVWAQFDGHLYRAALSTLE